MRKLTLKQEKFCQEYVKLGNASEAYRASYKAGRMKDKTINETASKLLKSPKITTRVKELKDEIKERNLYTVEKSIQRDLKLIERYERALDILEDNKSKKKDIEIAQRTLKYIGNQGYSTAQDRISKQQGFFEKDNTQKASSPRQIINMSDYKKD